ncbi:MAG: hypothetical protein GY953_40745, partial [bacterium]|nr:hypothetical protein [bacterium]
VSGPGGFFNPGTFDGTPCATLGQLPMTVSTTNARALIGDCATKYVPGTGTNGRPLWNEDYNNFAPVISIAWDPFGDGKTSIRTGFRISYLKDNFNIVDGNLDDNEGLRVNQQCNPVEGPTCNSNAEFLRQISSSGVPTPNTPAFALPASRTILDSSTIDFRTFDRDLSTAYYSEWTFGISREVGRGWAVEARYLGNRGVGLRRVADFNEINVNAVDPVTGQSFLDAFVKAQHNLECNSGSRFDDATGNDCVIPNPLMKALIAGDTSRLRGRTGLVTALERNQTGQFVHRLTQVETSRPKSGQSRIRGGSFWGQVLDGRFPVNFFQANPFVASSRVMVNDGFSTYHSLQLEVRRRFAQGLSVQTNYTYGKALADYDGDSSSLVNDVRPSSVINPRYSKQEFMPRHQFNANWVYELPVGVGKPFLNAGGMLNKIVGGWQLSGLLAFRSGRPLSISSNVGTFHRNAISDDNTVDVASGVTGVSLRGGSGVRDIGSGVFFVDPCLSGFNNVDCTGAGGVQSGLSLPRPGHLGALGQTVLFGPNRFLLDMSLMKRTQIRERYNLEFRWEVFNVLNRTNFGTPTLDITSSSFGQIQNTITEPRLMQFALKLNF